MAILPTEEVPPNLIRIAVTHAQYMEALLGNLKKTLTFESFAKASRRDLKQIVKEHLEIQAAAIRAYIENPFLFKVYLDELLRFKDLLLEHVTHLYQQHRLTWYYIGSKRRDLLTYRDQLNMIVQELRLMPIYWSASISPKQKFCMSHHGWTLPNKLGLCSQCGSAMLENEDLR